jgi:hypothetical protein
LCTQGHKKNKKQKKEGKIMNSKFDELTKSVARSATRRAALKKFGVGLTGMALACFGLSNKAHAAKPPTPPPPPTLCQSNSDCQAFHFPYNCCRGGTCGFCGRF